MKSVRSHEQSQQYKNKTLAICQCCPPQAVHLKETAAQNLSKPGVVVAGDTVVDVDDLATATLSTLN